MCTRVSSREEEGGRIWEGWAVFPRDSFRTTGDGGDSEEARESEEEAVDLEVWVGRVSEEEGFCEAAGNVFWLVAVFWFV